MVSPGGPAHVMLTDREAEHIPGCNMAFYKWALEEVGGFDPIFRQAGDDVDLCWRLQQAGQKLGFSPAALVWHYRRATVSAYLKQQLGYGEAEALLVRKHPEYFNSFGGSIWRGRIYTSSKFGLLLRRPIIYRGLFGSAGYQAIYASEPALSLTLCTTLEYYVLVALPLSVLSAIIHALVPLLVCSLTIPLVLCAIAGVQADLPANKQQSWSRPLVALLFLLQPIVRGWARYQGRLLPSPAPIAAQQTLDSIALRQSKQSLERISYSSDEPLNRLAYVANLLRRLELRGWPHRSDIGWSDFDVEIYDTPWSKLQLTTVTEARGHVLCCRLRGCWSLRGKVAFWSLAALEVFVLGILGRSWPWLLLVSLPLFAWFLYRQERNLQSVLVVFLDEIAKEGGLKRMESPKPESQSQTPVSAAARTTESSSRSAPQ